MKILQISGHYVPAYHYGGVLHVAHSIGKALVRAEHEVHVCTTNLRDPRHNLDVPTDVAVTIDGVQVFYEPVKYSRYWGFSPSLARRTWYEVKWADVILIHFHYQFASFVATWICRFQRKPFVIFTHGSLNRYSVSAKSTIRKRVYLGLLERGNFKRALFTAYHSQEELDSSIQFGQCHVIPNGIDPNEFRSIPPRGYFRQHYPELRDRLLYMFLGRLDAGKGLDLLLPAFARLRDGKPNVHLVLAGGDERGYRARVQQMIADLDLSNHVTLTGLISGTEKLGLLQDADVYVLPSRSEGLSIAMLEAMYMAVPVVVTDRVGLWRQIEANQCGKVVPLDTERLYFALEEMAETSDRHVMGQRGRKLVTENYTWTSIAQKLVNEIKNAQV